MMRIIDLGDEELIILGYNTESNDPGQVAYTLSERQIHKARLIILLHDAYSRHDITEQMARISSSMLIGAKEKRRFEKPRRKIMPKKNTSRRFERNHWLSRRK